MGIFGNKKSKKEENEPISKISSVEINEVEEPIEEEVVAVIMAAIMNCLNTSTYRLNIKSIKRIPNNVPVWNAVGRRENVDHQI